MEEIQNLQWFPGHMKKTEELIRENLELVDVIIEVLDARIPWSSRNPMFGEMFEGKAKISVFTKPDLANRIETGRWLRYFHENDNPAVIVDALKGSGLKGLISAVKALAEPKTHKLVKNGANPRPARAMVVGIPNVGKSSLINRLANSRSAKTANYPGATRSKQWIKIDAGMELLDTPGILYPKFEDQEVALKLAWVYAINDEIFDNEAVVRNLLEVLIKKIPANIAKCYHLPVPIPEDPQELLNQIGVRRGCLRKSGTINLDRAARLVLKEFRSGRIGPITLDKVPT